MQILFIDSLYAARSGYSYVIFLVNYHKILVHLSSRKLCFFNVDKKVKHKLFCSVEALYFSLVTFIYLFWCLYLLTLDLAFINLTHDGFDTYLFADSSYVLLKKATLRIVSLISHV